MRAACHILTCSLLAWCAAVPTASAGQLDDLASAKALTDAQKQSIRSTVEDGVKQLGSSDVDAVTTAREALSGWADERATPVFRGEFSKAACGPLADLVLRAEPIQAVNAIEVLRVVQTHEALQHLAKLANSATVTNVGVRLAAARALQAAIEAGTDMNSAQASGLVRLLTDAVEGETEWLSAWSQMSALGLIAKRSGMDAKAVGDARRGQVAGLKGIEIKVRTDGAARASLLKAAARTMNSMFVDLANAAADRASVSGSLPPILESFQKLGHSKPAGLQPDVQSAYDDAAKAADKLLGLFKPATKPAGKPTGKPAAKPAPKKPAN